MRLQLMLAGESAMVIAARGRRATEYKEKGAPMDYRLLDPYPAEPNGLALMRRAAHPHASMLFIDWMLSEEGQTVVSAANSADYLAQGRKTDSPPSGALQKRFRLRQSSLSRR